MELITKEKEREAGRRERIPDSVCKDEKLMRWKDAQGCMRQSCKGKSSLLTLWCGRRS